MDLPPAICIDLAERQVSVHGGGGNELSAPMGVGKDRLVAQEEVGITDKVSAHITGDTP